MKRRAILLLVIFLGLVSLGYAQAPVPFINLPLVPDATPPGGPQFTLTVNGTGFVSNSVVNWNGTPLATQFVNQSQLTATVPASDIATASTGWVTVVNPAPGGGTSSVVFFPVRADVGSAVAFSLASSLPLPAGGNPQSVAVGDFNGDGKLDLAVANYGGTTVSIFLGDGKGNFTLASSPAVGAGPISVAVGDFNGDGNLDLAVANFYGNTVSILLGDGTGNFTLASSPATGVNPIWAAVGDLNGDGNLDLAVVNAGDDTVSILLGDGTGNFSLASSLATGILPFSVAVGDFNGDGKLDLALSLYCGNPQSCSLGGVSIFMGDGTGNFVAGSSFLTGSSAESATLGDFNGDGKLDLAVANYGAATVSIFLGDGKGNFTPASSPAVGAGPCSLAVGDFSGNGKLDLATANDGSTTSSILLGDGAGNFTLSSSPVAGTEPTSVVAGDFTGDGKLGLAVGNYPNTVSILLQVPPYPIVALSPASLTFGTQLFGTSSDPQQVTLTNSGNATLDITRVATSPSFSQTNNCPRKLAPGGQCTVNVVFTPHKVNTINGTLSVYDNAPSSPQTVPLTGVGNAVTLLPSSLDFGNQQVGTTSPPQAVTLTNYAPKAVTIFSAGFTGEDARLFAVQSTTCGKILPANENCAVNIVFTPKGTGSKSATFNVNDNGGPSPQTVALSGNGTK